MRPRTQDNYWTISHKTHDHVSEALDNNETVELYDGDGSTSWEELIGFVQNMTRFHGRLRLTLHKHSVKIQKAEEK